MTTYLIISCALLFGYLCYKAGYYRGKYLGFKIGKQYNKVDRQGNAFEFKHYQTN